MTGERAMPRRPNASPRPSRTLKISQSLRSAPTARPQTRSSVWSCAARRRALRGLGKTICHRRHLRVALDCLIAASLWHLFDLSRARHVRVDPRHSAVQPDTPTAGAGNIGLLARREVGFPAAAYPRADLLGNKPAEVGAARARSAERHFMDLAACGDGATAVHGDAQRVLLDIGEVEFTGAVHGPLLNRWTGEPDDEFARREAVDDGVPRERAVVHAHMTDQFGVAADARLRLRSGLVINPRRKIDFDGVAANPFEIDGAGLACAGAFRPWRRGAGCCPGRPGSGIPDPIRRRGQDYQQRACRRDAQRHDRNPYKTFVHDTPLIER